MMHGSTLQQGPDPLIPLAPEYAHHMPPTIAGDTQTLAEVTAEFRQQEAEIALGGGRKAIARQHEKGRLTAGSASRS